MDLATMKAFTNGKPATAPPGLRSNYNVDLPAALAFFHLKRAAAAILAFTAADIFLRPLRPGLAAVPFTVAHLALAASDIRARPAALIFLLPCLPFVAGAEASEELPPRRPASSF